jgi:hypothetical protein
MQMGERGGAYVSEENKAMVRRMVEGINAGDIEKPPWTNSSPLGQHVG